MVDKLATRITERHRDVARAAATEWAQERVESADDYARALDPTVWAEAEVFSAALRARAEAVLPTIGIHLGGGGHYALLYFLVRMLRPDVVVETGVAAGWSTAAILGAMERNERGHLWSSDFPYFRLAEPEQYIGVLVDDSLRERWTLLLDGDRANLRHIAERVDRIDLFHYDSDKSYRGRSRAVRLLGEKLHAQSVILMDDIQNNCYFRDILAAPHRSRVFGFEGKYIGTVALPGSP
jgi:predicted O-methyltransferase YrrM